MDASIQSRGIGTVTRPLLAWYDRHARVLPWRSPPGSPLPDPYRVWLSEVMLQQTTVSAVIPHFERFTARWPTVAALAEADEADVMAAWAGLGYYSRARNLVAAARMVAARGDFPASEAELRQLPGLGAYTAAAIAAIAFGEAAAVVDANVERVAARLYAVADPLPGARGVLRRHVAALTPTDRPGDFAQAMMDLGSAVCTPRNPKCLVCPLAGPCAARAAGEQERYPVKAPKRARPERKGTAWWIERGGAVLLVTRPPRGMLGGMRALPSDDWSARGDGNGAAPVAAEWREAGRVRHGFTHFDLELAVKVAVVGEGVLDGEWWPIDRLAQAGLPTLFARACRARAGLEDPAAQHQAKDRRDEDDQAEIAPGIGA
jgi:A/G-specific adenine glycosylase